MYIAVIHHSHDFSNDYAAYLSKLLDDTATEYGYEAKDYHHQQLVKDPLPKENLLLHIVIPATGGFSLKYWYAVKLPSIFKKYKIEKVLCLYATCTSSKVQQLLIFPGTELLQPGKKMQLWKQFAAKRLTKSIQAAKHIVTYSQHAKKALQDVGITGNDKTLVLPYTVNEIFKPLEWHDKLYIKSRFAENKEYFISVLGDNDEKSFTELLKAFSKFKKWQQSSMQLILLPKEEAFGNKIYDKLDTYKYRDDVKLVNDAEKKETADLMASAYAFLHIAVEDADLLAITAALQSGTPVLAYHTESLQEYCGDAAILVKEQSHEAFGDQLTQLYKNETLRSQMGEAAVKKAEALKQKEHAATLWQHINAS